MRSGRVCARNFVSVGFFTPLSKCFSVNMEKLSSLLPRQLPENSARTYEQIALESIESTLHQEELVSQILTGTGVGDSLGNTAQFTLADVKDSCRKAFQRAQELTQYQENPDLFEEYMEDAAEEFFSNLSSKAIGQLSISLDSLDLFKEETSVDSASHSQPKLSFLQSTGEMNLGSSNMNQLTRIAQQSPKGLSTPKEKCTPNPSPRRRRANNYLTKPASGSECTPSSTKRKLQSWSPHGKKRLRYSLFGDVGTEKTEMKTGLHRSASDSKCEIRKSDAKRKLCSSDSSYELSQDAGQGQENLDLGCTALSQADSIDLFVSPIHLGSVCSQTERVAMDRRVSRADCDQQLLEEPLKLLTGETLKHLTGDPLKDLTEISSDLELPGAGQHQGNDIFSHSTLIGDGRYFYKKDASHSEDAVSEQSERKPVCKPLLPSFSHGSRAASSQMYAGSLNRPLNFRIYRQGLFSFLDEAELILSNTKDSRVLSGTPSNFCVPNKAFNSQSKCVAFSDKENKSPQGDASNKLFCRLVPKKSPYAMEHVSGGWTSDSQSESLSQESESFKSLFQVPLACSSQQSEGIANGALSTPMQRRNLMPVFCNSFNEIEGGSFVTPVGRKIVFCTNAPQKFKKSAPAKSTPKCRRSLVGKFRDMSPRCNVLLQTPPSSPVWDDDPLLPMESDDEY